MAEARLRADSIAKKLHGAFCRGVARTELLQTAASLVRATGEPYTGVYMYMLDATGQTLVLEASDGRGTTHTAIPVGHGLCGKAVRDRQDVNVPDVTADHQYLACSLETRSELIVLIRRNEEILGQIDIDSDTLDGFDDAEHAAVTAVADALAALL